MEPPIEFADVTDLDALPEHRLAVAFHGSLHHSGMQEVDSVISGFVGLRGEIRVAVQVVVRGPFGHMGGAARHRFRHRHREITEPRGPPTHRNAHA